MSKKSNIKVSVYHIIHFCESIDKSFTSYNELLSLEAFDKNQNEEIRRMIFINMGSQILLQTVSLKDEFAKYFNVSKVHDEVEKDKVEKLREILKPVFKQINKWKGIKKFRDNVLAHELRIREKEYKSVFEEGGMSGYNIPERMIDFAFLVKCIKVIHDYVYQAFKDEYHEIEELLNSDKYVGTPLLVNRDYNKEYLEMMDEITKIQLSFLDK